MFSPCVLLPRVAFVALDFRTGFIGVWPSSPSYNAGAEALFALAFLTHFGFFVDSTVVKRGSPSVGVAIFLLG